MFSEASMNSLAEGIQLTNGSATSNWQFLGPINLTSQNLGIIVSLAFDPTNNIIYAGTNASGLWKTTDAGDNWEIIFENNLTYWTYKKRRLRDIEFHANNTDILFASSDGFQSYGVTPVGFITNRTIEFLLKCNLPILHSFFLFL